MTMTRTIGLGLGVALVLGVPPADAQSISPEGFDPARWADFGRAGVVRIAETTAGQVLSGLHLRGGPRSENNNLTFVDPNAITSITATVTLLDVLIPPPDSGSSQAGIVGFFYWDGTGSGGSSDSTGHVIALVTIDADEVAQAVQARFFAGLCTDPGCNTVTVLSEEVLRASVAPFEPHRLRLSYDGTKFTAQVGSDTPFEFTPPDPPGSRLPPANRFKALRTRVRTSDVPTAEGRILAAFDRVEVNGAPYDDFQFQRLPRLHILPGPTATLGSTQVLDVVVVVESGLGSGPVTSGRLFLNDVDVTSAVSQAVIEPLATGGLAVRFPGVAIGSLVPAGTRAFVAAEVAHQNGPTARGSAFWHVVGVVE